MPTYDPRARYPRERTRVMVPTLSGGVGRQAPTKRALNEAENLDNVLVTLERSVEKRAGTNSIKRYTTPAFTAFDSSHPDSSLGLFDQSSSADYGFFWFQVSEEQRYLIALNFASTNVNQYMQIFRVTKDGFYECTITGQNTTAMLEYFTYKGGDTSLKFDDSLSSITLGPQMLVNNKNVYAGYTSKKRIFAASDTLDGSATDTDSVGWCKVGLDGEYITTGTSTKDYKEDIKGRKLTYFTTTPVDTEGQASIYVDGKFYIKNDQVYVNLPVTTDLTPWTNRQIKGAGSMNFTQLNTADFQVPTEDLPTVFTDLKVSKIRVDTDNNAELVTVFFNEEKYRDAWLELTRFNLAEKALPMSSGEASGTSGSFFTVVYSGADTKIVVDELETKQTAAGTYPFSITYDFVGTTDELDDVPSELTNSAYVNSQNIVTASAGITVVYTCLQDGSSNGALPTTALDAASTEAYFTFRGVDDGGAFAKHIPVEDWRYPDSTRRYLGNTLSDFSEFKFPPKANEATADNDGTVDTGTQVADFNLPPVNMAGKVGATLEDLYSDVSSNGKGKIYYVENSYAGEVPGYYIVNDVSNSPYTRLIRTPEEYSVLDQTRFPKVIKINSFNSTTNVEEFIVQDLDLEERRSGNLKTNKGPEVFKEGRQSRIRSMAFFRDRLFLSADDTVFSSRTGDFSDFWVQNPGVVADTDPIDIRLSTNKYAEVESMTPFSSNMFVNTGSDIQFTLKGSENNITPFTAEVSPTAFYSTAPLVDPVLLGSQIYFFAPNRAYVYFNDSMVTVNQAIEVSLNCPNYLPKTFGDIGVVPGYDSLCMIDKDNLKFLYVYTNRYRGADVVQNAFYRYIYDMDLMSVNSYDNDIYLIPRQYNSGSDNFSYFLEFQKFYEEDHSVPRLDHQTVLTETGGIQGTVVYNSSNDTTTFAVNNYGNLNPDTLYIAVENELEERAGEIILLRAGRDNDIVVSDPTNVNGLFTVVLRGDYTTLGNIRKFIFGTSFTSTVQLSPQYVRDGNNNVVEGVLSLRTLHLQHHNTGSYRVEKSIRGRRQEALRFTPSELDESQVTDPTDIPMPLYEKTGESFTKILGYAIETDIFIVSDYPNPMNIAQIEFKGRFTDKTSGFVR